LIVNSVKNDRFLKGFKYIEESGMLISNIFLNMNDSLQIGWYNFSREQLIFAEHFVDFFMEQFSPTDNLFKYIRILRIHHLQKLVSDNIKE